MKIKHMIGAIILASLTGCGTTIPRMGPAPTPPPEPTIAASIAKVRCPDLDPITDPAPLGLLVKYVNDLQQQYVTCATRLDSLQDAATKPKK